VHTNFFSESWGPLPFFLGFSKQLFAKLAFKSTAEKQNAKAPQKSKNQQHVEKNHIF
jgi:hypothetical protein